MTHHKEPSVNPTGPQLRKVLRGTIRRSQTLYYPDSMIKLRDGQHKIPPNLMPVNRSTFGDLKKVTHIISDQIHTHIGNHGVYPVARCLERIAVIVVAETSGTFDYAVLGYAEPIDENQHYIALARTDLGRRITRYELAGTLFHELTHAADQDCDRINLDEYEEVYERYAHLGILDPHTEAALYDETHRTELMARAFHGALFGLPEPSRNKTEFKARVKAWRKCCPELVKLVESDFLKVFSEQRYLQIIRKTRVTTTKQITRPIKKREGYRDARIHWFFRQHKMDPLHRGKLLWLREQALQAENDPNREWDGFQAEWDQLMAGTHPDPHPEHIIYGHPVENFDPTKLENPLDRVRLLDDQCYGIATSHEPKAKGFDLPPNSQQFYAAISRCGIENLLNHDTGTTQKFDVKRNTKSRTRRSS